MTKAKPVHCKNGGAITYNFKEYYLKKEKDKKLLKFAVIYGK